MTVNGAKMDAAILPFGLQAAEANTRWLARHPRAWMEHAGEWLCVVDGELVVAERERGVFAERVGQLTDADGALILRIPTAEEAAIAALERADRPIKR